MHMSNASRASSSCRLPVVPVCMLVWCLLVSLVLLPLVSQSDATYTITGGSSGDTYYHSEANIGENNEWMLNNHYPAKENGFVTQFVVWFTENPNEEFRWSRLRPINRTFTFKAMDATGIYSSMAFTDAAVPTSGECTAPVTCVVSHTLSNVVAPANGKYRLDLRGSGLYLKKGQFLAVSISHPNGVAIIRDKSTLGNLCHTSGYNQAASTIFCCGPFCGSYQGILSYSLDVKEKSTSVSIDTVSLSQLVAASARVTLPVQVTVTGENPPTSLVGLGVIILVSSTGTRTPLPDSTCTAITSAGTSECTVSFAAGGVNNVLAAFVNANVILASSISDNASPAVITVASRTTTLTLEARSSRSPVSVTAQTSSTPFAAGNNITLAAVLSPASATGTVRFYWSTGGVVILDMDGVDGRAVNVVNGVALLEIPHLLDGRSYVFDASFTPADAAAYVASRSASSFTVSKDAAALTEPSLALGTPVLDVTVGVAALGGNADQWVLNLQDTSHVAGQVKEVYIAYESAAFASGISSQPLSFAVLHSAGNLLTAASTASLPTGFLTTATQPVASPILTNPQRIDVSSLRLWLEAGHSLAVRHTQASAVLRVMSAGNAIYAAAGSQAPGSVTEVTINQTVAVWVVAGPTTSSIVVTGPAAPLAAGASFNLSAKVTPLNSAGQVVFEYADGTALSVTDGASSQVTVAAGVASVQATGFTFGGVRTIRARFLSTAASILSSTSATVQVFILPAPVQVSLQLVPGRASSRSNQADRVEIGQPAQLRVEVRPAAAAGTVRIEQVDAQGTKTVLQPYNIYGANSAALTLSPVSGGAASEALFDTVAFTLPTGNATFLPTATYVATFLPTVAAAFVSSNSSVLSLRASKIATNVELTWYDPFRFGTSLIESGTRAPLYLMAQIKQTTSGAIITDVSAGTISIYTRTVDASGESSLLPLLINMGSRSEPTKSCLLVPMSGSGATEVFPSFRRGLLGSGGDHSLVAVFDPTDVSDAGLYAPSPRPANLTSIVVRIQPVAPSLTLTVSPSLPRAGNLLNISLSFPFTYPDVPTAGLLRFNIDVSAIGESTWVNVRSLSLSMPESGANDHAIRVDQTSSDVKWNVVMRLPFDIPLSTINIARITAHFHPNRTNQYFASDTEFKWYLQYRSTDPSDQPVIDSSTGEPQPDPNPDPTDSEGTRDDNFKIDAGRRITEVGFGFGFGFGFGSGGVLLMILLAATVTTRWW